jgi:mannose-6-phosphate isomerase-like protein (cupin superfamily)
MSIIPLQKPLPAKIVDDNTTVNEYTNVSSSYSVATAKITGRHPMSGFIANTENEQAYFVTSGSGIIYFPDGREFKINKGDYVHFAKGQFYAASGEELEIVLFNTPAWRPEQMISMD